MKQILKLALLMAIGFLTNVAVAQQQACKVVTYGPGGLTDQLFRIMEKHNPNFRVTYRIAAYNVTSVELLSQDPSYMMLSPPVFYSKQNPRPDPNIEMVKVLSSSNAAIVTNKDIKISDLANKKLNVGIPAFAQYSHVLSLTLQQKNSDLNIVVVPPNQAPGLIKQGDLDIYIHTEPTVDTFVNNFNFRKISVIRPDIESDFNGIKTKSLHFSSIWISKTANQKQREHINSCLQTLVDNKAFEEDLAKTGSTSRLSLPKSESSQYLLDFISMLRNFNL